MSKTGVPIAEATAKDFIMVRAALVQRLGGANEALVWTRIDWRTGSKDAHQVGDGRHWWAATYPELADETGLTAEQVRRAVERLLEGGYLLAEQHHGFSRTRSYSTVIAHLANLPDGENASSKRRTRQMDLANSPNAPLYRDVREETKTTSDVAGDTDYAPDVYRLSNLLGEAVAANGHKVGEIGKRWWSACDRLLRIDEYTVEQVEWMIRWATSNEFWSANIRSMSTLREKFSTLKAQAMRDAQKTQAQSPTARANSVVEMGRRLASSGVAS